jgi:hypothetical protein
MPLTDACLLSSRKKIACLLGLIVLLTIVAASQITADDIRSDGVQNLRFADNVAQYGIFSSTPIGEPIVPGNEREPLPPYVLSAHLRLLNVYTPGLEGKKLLTGNGARMVKFGNMIWVFLGLVGVALLSFSLTGNYSFVVFMLLLQTFFFFALPFFVDTLYTELQAGVLLLWSSWLLLKAVQTSRLRWFCATGLCMGLLALTKGVFLYVAPVAMAVLAWMFIFQDSLILALKRFTVMLVGFSFLTLPWMVRNKLVTGHFELTQRGGHVLLTRAVKNAMTLDEVEGAFFFWGPSFYQKLSSPLGLGAVPSDFQLGGRFQRLNRESSNFKSSDLVAQAEGKPEAAISYYRKAASELSMYVMQAQYEGSKQAQRDGDDHAKRRAKSLILSSPHRHALMTIPFFWRGIWSQPNQGVIFKSNPVYVIFKDILALASILALYTMFVIGLLRRKLAYLAISLLPVLMVSFYAGITHNIPRYPAAAIPLMLTCLAFLVVKSLKGNHFDSSLCSPKKTNLEALTRSL